MQTPEPSHVKSSQSPVTGSACARPVPQRSQEPVQAWKQEGLAGHRPQRPAGECDGEACLCCPPPWVVQHRPGAMPATGERLGLRRTCWPAGSPQDGAGPRVCCHRGHRCSRNAEFSRCSKIVSFKQIH